MLKAIVDELAQGRAMISGKSLPKLLFFRRGKIERKCSGPQIPSLDMKKRY